MVMNLLISFFQNILFLFFFQQNGETSLFVATQKGHQNIVQLLLEKGANVDAPVSVFLFFSFFFFILCLFSFFLYFMSFSLFF